MKKLIAGLAAGAALLLSVTPALAAGKSAPKTTGGVGYDAYGLSRRAEFNAISTSTTCSPVWNVTGTFLINVNYLNIDYPETLVLTQSGTAITGVNLDTVPPASLFTITGGSVIGNAITIDANQGTLIIQMVGTIANDGSMSGSWHDVIPTGTRTGTWTSTSGNANAVAVTGCTGKGTFKYSDVNGDWYFTNVQYVNVNGTDAYFAGQVTSASQPSWVGNWVFVKTHDGGEPSVGVDQIWGSFATEAAAKAGVALMSNPGDGPFAITSGNLQVH